MLKSLIRAALSQRLLVLVVSVVLVGFGVRAAMRLSVDAFPDVTNVQVQVATEVPGRSPEEVERFVTVPLEVAMTGLPGLTEMRALNRAGLSLITLVFTDKTDVYFARQLVMERLLEVTPRMPAGVVPVLGPVSTGLGEVYQYTLVHPDDGHRELTPEELMERRVVQDWVLRPMLRSIPGVAEINSMGGLERQFQVLVNPDRLRHYRLSLREVLEAVERNNANAGGGVLRSAAEQYLIRGVGLIRSAEDIGNIILKEEQGVPVFVRDVAQVQIGAAVRQGAVVRNGDSEAVAGIVMMLRGGNAKEVVGRVKAKVNEINQQGLLPGGLQVEPFYDRTELVDSALWMVTKVLLEGIVFIIIILFLFLGDVRSSLVVVATIVITPLVTFMMMNRLGLSANLMSLGGLAIAIGLMVDGTVVVVENVFHKLGQAGNSRESRLRLILEATSEIAKPTVYGISIIILVFLPLMMLSGMEGKMFGPLALTIAIALAVSLAVSLFLSPVLCSYILRGGNDHDTRPIAFLKRHYLRLLHLALSAEKKTILVAVALLLGSMALFPLLGKSFIPTMKEGSIVPQIVRVPSISLEESLKVENEAMRLVAQVPGVKSVISKLGRGESPADPAGPNESDPIAVIDREAGRSQGQIEEDIRKALAVLPGVQVIMNQPIAQRVDEMVTGVRSQLAIKVFGDDLDELRRVSEDLARIVRTVPGAIDIRVERLTGQQTLTIDIDRQAIARYGINVADVNDLIETAFGGNEVGQLFEGQRRFGIVVRYPAEYRSSVESIRNSTLRTSDGTLVPLSAVARIELQDSPPTISRESGKRRVVVGANVTGRDLGGFVAEVQRRVDAELRLPEGYFLSWGGQFENMERAMETLMVIVPLTIAAIFFLLFMLFNSLRLASLIILVLPFASIGGVIGLFVTGEYLSVPASVGFIALWGIAVLNGVVLVSCIRRLREDGMRVPEAVREGCVQRFRPVMMTATVALLGLVPFLFANGPGAEVQRPLAVVVIGGLISSTLLTLVVVPTLYRWFDDLPQEA
ncbi:MAG: efflux RND transporter permease subunit [Limnohabitans sp.]|jgi:cobalt-zinc-cadmium resistance protein CzcA|uniref:efflux RND transporter permease subunit n=1 Tax=Limnohabitans sp. TaxID=1907725 RepID=UPI0011DA1DC7|nr:MAG: efflux RND transporter permease subunit [Limnohabitans sp.]